MNCPACNEITVSQARFCRRCGASLADDESTSVFTRRDLPSSSVVFPATGSPVVPLQGIQDLRIPFYVLPDEPLAFSINPNLLTKFFAEALEPRGLLMLKMGYVSKGSGISLWDDQPYVPDTKVEGKHIELMFARNPNFSASWEVHDPTVTLHFQDVETVTIKKGFLRRLSELSIKLKPGKTLRFLEVDQIIRELNLTISRKDLPIAARLLSAIQFELSQTRLASVLP